MAEQPGDDLQDLKSRIQQVKSHDDDTGNNDDNAPASQGIGRAMGLATELLAGVIVGTVLGYYLDQWLGTAPLLMIVFLFLGAAAGYRNLAREVKRNNQ